MSAKFQASRGTFDVLPAEAAHRARVAEAARGLLGRAGYGRIETPAFEDTELFARGVGQATDIVRKEMFSFTDQGGRELTLRPEGTAPIARAYLEHGMQTLAQPVRLWYAGPFFRHERPQAGRFRQFNQVGAEAIGSDSPLVDAELIVLLDDLLGELGVAEVRLRLSSLGGPGSRAAYRDELRDHLRAHESELAPEVRERIDENPLRAFDSEDDDTRAVMAAAPTMLERLDHADAEHFDEVRRLLDHAGVDYELDGTLVRGLDYYTRTVFEFESGRLGAQAALGGGGRYDGLVEQLGGPATPGCGWAAGVERILLALDEPRAGARARRLRRRPRRAPRAGLFARRRAAPGRDAGRARPRRALAQGPDEAGRPGRRPGGDRARRVGVGAASRHVKRRAAADRARAGTGGAALSAPGPEPPALRANEYRDAWCGQVLADRVGSEARLAGWVHRRRDHGGLVFIDLRDRTGLVQLVFDPDQAGEAFELAHRLRAEDVLSVAGEVVRRAPETVNPELPTGEFEVRVAEARRLADSETPPFEIEGFSGEVGEEARLRHRYLDLRRERMREAIELRHLVAAAIRDFLAGEGFLEIETPMLSRSTPEGARDFLVPSRREPGAFYALPQSPQLFKQLLMVAGFERYFQIVRCFRDEDQRADRQPDFTQLDLEMSFVGVEDVIDLNERLLAAVFERVGGPALSLPLPRLAYDDAIARFGTDRPDLRFGLELVELTELLAATEFKVFRGVVEAGGVVKGINAGAPRGPARGPGRVHLPRPGARRQGAGLGLSGGRGVALADREVPLRAGARSAQRALRRRRGGPAAGGRRRARDRELGARPASARARRALRADRPRGGGVLLDHRLADVRVERRGAALGPAPPPVHRSRRASSTPSDPGQRGRAPTTWSGTVRSSAAVRSGSPTRRCSSACSS